MIERKYVYSFRQGEADGDGSMKDLLGGKGANLAEMARDPLRLPVPAGFTITTEACREYFANGRTFPPGLWEEVSAALGGIESHMGRRFGGSEKPLLLSVRSGGRRSMPGMMETVLNIGLNDETARRLVEATSNEWFVYDAYRRLIAMYADVVLEKAAGIDPEEGQSIRQALTRLLEAKVRVDGMPVAEAELASRMREAVAASLQEVRDRLGTDIPTDPREQLRGAVGAVFASWYGKRAVAYRRIEGIPDDWGTAVNVQAMVFGNFSKDTSATGVAFTRNPATGANEFYGEWLPGAQGEDVVAGIRTPNPLNEASRNVRNAAAPSLAKAMPEVYADLCRYRAALEDRFHDMQDLEFTVEQGRLWMLQTRTGKRNGLAALGMALDMLDEGLIDRQTAVMRVEPRQLDELLHPIVDPEAEKGVEPLATGLPAGPGGACGQIVFTAEAAVQWAGDGKSVILLRHETNPEDVEGMRAATGILTAHGGMTSHAALVARGWGKCCVVGAEALAVDAAAKTATVGEVVLREGDRITLDGNAGHAFVGALALKDVSGDPRVARFMAMAEEEHELALHHPEVARALGRGQPLVVRANADTPEQARQALANGARGIGLFRTEHMFYGEKGRLPLSLLRRMILCDTAQERREALSDLSLFVKRDIRSTLEAMAGHPVTIRLLDPPLHEFVPRDPAEVARLAGEMGLDRDELERRGQKLAESNPMMGHRGVRLGVTFPEVTEMQVRAILEAAAELTLRGIDARPEIMVPVTALPAELEQQRSIVDRIHEEVRTAYRLERLRFTFGTMIELPRAALRAGDLAEHAEFFSFGTNDLTQMTFGFSRDDAGGFLPLYLRQGLIGRDPFQVLDREAVGELVRIGIERGRAVRRELEVGICGEHGREPSSVEFCYLAGMDYVSCSPFRVPIARLAAAQTAIQVMREELREA